MAKPSITMKTPLGTLMFRPKNGTLAPMERQHLRLVLQKAADDLAFVKAAPWLEAKFGKESHGDRLRGLREVAGWSLRKLARLSGVPHSHLSEMEHGKRTLGLKMAQRLSKVFKVRYHLLLP